MPACWRSSSLYLCLWPARELMGIGEAMVSADLVAPVSLWEVSTTPSAIIPSNSRLWQKSSNWMRTQKFPILKDTKDPSSCSLPKTHSQCNWSSYYRIMKNIHRTLLRFWHCRETLWIGPSPMMTFLLNICEFSFHQIPYDWHYWHHLTVPDIFWLPTETHHSNRTLHLHYILVVLRWITCHVVPPLSLLATYSWMLLSMKLLVPAWWNWTVHMYIWWNCDLSTHISHTKRFLNHQNSHTASSISPQN